VVPGVPRDALLDRTARAGGLALHDLPPPREAGGTDRLRLAHLSEPDFVVGGIVGGCEVGGAEVVTAQRLGLEVIALAAVGDQRSPLWRAAAADVVFRNGRAIFGDAAESLTDIAARSPGLHADGAIAPGDTYRRYSQNSYAAYFAEVQVDMDTAEVRARRMLGVFDAGRILNVGTARSQLIGGMVWGLSAALHEEGVVDPRYGNFITRDLASYHFAANADTPRIEIVMLDGVDDSSNPLGSKGLGELAICGSGAAIANAVFNATGVRVRSFPITLDKILGGLPHAL
jgi:xanthine dehydrogenase YagR molybdenum-binding subunit